MTELEQYLAAVGMRKSITKTSGATRINHAVLYQLEGCDVPRLIELARIGGETLQRIVSYCDAHAGGLSEDAEEVQTYARMSFAKMEELSSTGSKAKWGPHGPAEPGNGKDHKRE